jgi:hypothetical protein
MNDAQSTRVRRALSLVSKELAGLTAAPHTQLDRVFGALVTELDLGPEPQRRTCPHCGAEGMTAATRCGKCWSKLTPA